MLTIPENAPFTGTQRMWLKGYLAGIAAGLPQAGPPTAAAPAADAPKSGLPVTILWGSQTGTAELNFAIFALGDSNYPEFCKCGHDFQNRLNQLGAKATLPIMTSDVDHDLPFKEWSSSVLSSLVIVH